MNNQPKLDKYKQEIADLYTRRSQTYDNSDWHLQIARRLVEYGQVSSGQQVLDIATGTGHVAIAAAQIVGPEGRVIGVDISAGMLDVARNKALELNLNNTEFLLADAENLDFPGNSCDSLRDSFASRIFCSSAAHLDVGSARSPHSLAHISQTRGHPRHSRLRRHRFCGWSCDAESSRKIRHFIQYEQTHRHR